MVGEGDIQTLVENQPPPKKSPTFEHTPTADALEIEDIGTSVTAEDRAEVSQEAAPNATVIEATETIPETVVTDPVESASDAPSIPLEPVLKVHEASQSKSRVSIGCWRPPHPRGHYRRLIYSI